jgi:hypothetical protein
VRGQGWLYFWERTPGEYEAHGYKLGLGMKDNSESALPSMKAFMSAFSPIALNLARDQFQTRPLLSLDRAYC